MRKIVVLGRAVNLHMHALEPSIGASGGLSMMPTARTAPGEDWLQTYLVESIRKNLCTQIFCTTCGAMDFRQGLLIALAKATGQPPVPQIDHESALAIAAALARVRAAVGEQRKLEDAVRLVLFEIWSTVGEVAAERQLYPILQGTWAGSVLVRMKEHHKERKAARYAFAENQDPVRVQQRREEQRRLKQERHVARLAMKIERDRIWREKQKRGDT